MSMAIIAGSGMAFLEPSGGWRDVGTPYGMATVASMEIGGREVVLLRRHGPSLNVPPHLINYTANMRALRDMGVTHIIATAAVGSLRFEIPPGTLSVISDFIDFTKRRAVTSFDTVGERVVHVDFSVPYCTTVSEAIEISAHELGVALGRPVVYLCVDGPRYETPSEVRMFAQWGGDVVGMTGVPEVVIARELGMCYGAIAAVTNYASGISERPLSHEDVLKSVGEHEERIGKIIEKAVSLIPETRECCLPPKE